MPKIITVNETQWSWLFYFIWIWCIIGLFQQTFPLLYITLISLWTLGQRNVWGDTVTVFVRGIGVNMVFVCTHHFASGPRTLPGPGQTTIQAERCVCLWKARRTSDINNCATLTSLIPHWCLMWTWTETPSALVSHSAVPLCGWITAWIRRCTGVPCKRLVVTVRCLRPTLLHRYTTDWKDCSVDLSEEETLRHENEKWIHIGRARRGRLRWH